MVGRDSGWITFCVRKHVESESDETDLFFLLDFFNLASGEDEVVEEWNELPTSFSCDVSFFAEGFSTFLSFVHACLIWARVDFVGLMIIVHLHQLQRK